MGKSPRQSKPTAVKRRSPEISVSVGSMGKKAWEAYYCVLNIIGTNMTNVSSPFEFAKATPLNSLLLPARLGFESFGMERPALRAATGSDQDYRDVSRDHPGFGRGSCQQQRCAANSYRTCRRRASC